MCRASELLVSLTPPTSTHWPTLPRRSLLFPRHAEIIDAPTYKASSLPFPSRSVEEVAALPPAELEAFLTDVYKSLASRDLPVADKVHVLAYLYPICKQDAVANIVINSSFATLLLQMIKRFKSSSLRCLLVTLIGVLVRHATFIVPDVGPQEGEKDGAGDGGCVAFV